ncbi:MAG: tetratricopeptide repeat protein [Anaerolineae bacterium]|nr:tetratricopeptide repeat protein [Anaerolineae bacterium]
MGLRNFFEILFGVQSSAPAPASEMHRWQGMLTEGKQARLRGEYAQALEIFEQILQEARQMLNPTAEATILGHIGAVYVDQERWEDAERVLGQAVDIAQAERNPMLLAAVHNDWGDYWLARGEQRQAEDAYTQSLEYARQGGSDPNLTAHVLGQLADVYMTQDNASYARRLLEEANQLTRYQMPAYLGRLGLATIAMGHSADGHRYLMQALRLAHVLGDVEEEVRWARALARRHAEEGKLYDASRLYQRVGMLVKQGASLAPKERLRYLLGRAEVTAQLGQHEEAIGYAEEAITIGESLQRTNDIAQAHGLIGSAYRALGQYDRAVGHLQIALSHLSEDVPRERVIALRLELARVQQEQDPAAALETIQGAVARARDIDATEELAAALKALGRLHLDQGRSAEALEAWKEAVQHFETLGDHQHLAPLLCDIANVLKEQAERKQALTLYEQALVHLNSVKHPATRGLVLSNVANMFTDTGDVETAKAFYDESISIARDTGDRAAESLRLGNLGWFYVVTGQAGKAVEALEQALVLSRQAGATLMQAVQSDNLAQAYARMGDYPAALPLHRQALALAQESGNRRWQAAFHSNLGETLARRGEVAEARQQLEQALALSRELGSDEMTARTLWRLGDLDKDTNNHDAAAASYEDAARIARRLGVQRDLAHALLGQGLLARASGLTGQAQSLLEEAKRLFAILHAPERRVAEDALRHLAASGGAVSQA